jgi:hypothetical protein
LDMGASDLHGDFDHLPMCLTLPDHPAVAPVPEPPAAGAGDWGAGASFASFADQESGLPPDWYEQIEGELSAGYPVFSRTHIKQYAVRLKALLPTSDNLLASEDVLAVVSGIQQCLQEAASSSMPWVAGGASRKAALGPLDKLTHVVWYTPDLARMRKQLDRTRVLLGATSVQYAAEARVYKRRCRAARKAAHATSVSCVV